MHRLYCKGRVLGHKRAKRNTRPNTSLIQIEGVATKEDAQFYLGKVCIHYPFVTFEIDSVVPIACSICLQSQARDPGLEDSCDLGVRPNVFAMLVQSVI